MLALQLATSLHGQTAQNPSKINYALAVRPTGRMIFYHLESLTLRPGTATSPPVILINRGVQAHLLELLGIDETRPRWLET